MTSPYPPQGDPYGQQYGNQSQAGASYELGGPAQPASGYTDPYAQQADPYTNAYQQPAYAPQPQPVYQPVPVPVPMAGYPAMPGYGVDPMTGMPLSDKSKLTAGLLQIFLGGFGVGRFYTGHIGMAIGQIAATWLTCGFGAIWPLIDGIVLLASSTATDSDGRLLRS